MNGKELCPEQACELSGECELARVKLSGLYCKKKPKIYMDWLGVSKVGRMC